jgi:hypothetical protein
MCFGPKNPKNHQWSTIDVKLPPNLSVLPGIILSGMLIFSSFVSAITNAMNQLRNLNSCLAQG